MITSTTCGEIPGAKAEDITIVPTNDHTLVIYGVTQRPSNSPGPKQIRIDAVPDPLGHTDKPPCIPLSSYPAPFLPSSDRRLSRGERCKSVSTAWSGHSVE